MTIRKTSTERLAQFELDHVAKRAQLERELKIEAALPVPPVSVHSVNATYSFVNYEVGTLADAMDVFHTNE